MIRPVRVLVVLALVSAASVSVARADTTKRPYIVVLEASVAHPGAKAGAQGKALGFQPKLVYRYALKGYSARLSESAVAALRSNPEVDFVSPDGTVSAAQTQPPQVISNSVLRIDGDESSTASGDGSGSVDINVAVLDTGIDLTHPDLNVVGGVSCRGKKGDFDDMAGHGTLVGGWIGALDNDIGRVGVAPGARLWAVRVLDERGFGPNSAVICGLDWATGTRMDSDPSNDVAVVNMSLGGPAGKATGSCIAAPKDAFHAANCRAMAAGITIVAAAGNESVDFQDISPATYDEVLTATAMADRDGEPGGLGGQFMCDPAEFDDTPATFTNFATLPSDQAHAIAAPGVCISSTSVDGGYGIGSGTSFAAPHVAGTVALCIWSGPCAGLTPQQITEKIVADAAAYNTADPDYGFEGDPLRPQEGKYFGYLIRAAQY